MWSGHGYVIKNPEHFLLTVMDSGHALSLAVTDTVKTCKFMKKNSQDLLVQRLT